MFNPGYARLDVTGNWNVSTGPLALTQSGTAVTGTIGTGLHAARLQGTLANNVLSGTWRSSFFPAAGQIYLQFALDGRSYSGIIAVAGQHVSIYGQRT